MCESNYVLKREVKLSLLSVYVEKYFNVKIIIKPIYHMF